ncbi:MAG: hypothetical protein DIU71_01860 [Proteobacteria bacterium]|nr:MAG: hypothetical protein DIU71_01860 [Pseudomonadota bacterium]
MAGAIERGDHAARVVVHRHGERYDAVGELVFDRGIAGAATFPNEFLQFGRVGHRAVGERLEGGLLEIPRQALRTESREQHSSHGGRIGRKAAAHMGLETDQRTH